MVGITEDNVKSTEAGTENSRIITDSVVNNPSEQQDITTKSVNSDSNKSNKVYTDNAVKYPNLKPFNPKFDNKLTTREAQERGRKGGIKSGEVRRQKKTMRETLENALKIELSPEKLEELGADISLMDGETSVLSAIIASTIREAINGDTKAIQFVRDSIGEQPTIKQEITETITKEDTELMHNLSKALIG